MFPNDLQRNSTPENDKLSKHDEAIGFAVSRKLADLSTEFNKPVTLGIIGPGATWQQAEQRAEDYAERALVAAIKLLEELEKV